MADTQTLVLSLAKSLPDLVKDYTLYLDNLFPSIPLAVELGKLGIEIMSTARVTTLELSSSLIQLKCGKEILEWGHLRVAIIKRILCFLWQDNNWMLGKILT
jgi:Transposase IS4